MKKIFILFTVLFAFLSSQTLDTIKARGYLTCGVSSDFAGFSSKDARGKWTGFDVDYCRAISAAIFKDADKIKFVSLSAKNRFTALRKKDIDILSRSTAWTLFGDSSFGVNFVGVLYYDFQGFLVKKSSKIKNVKDLNGLSICVSSDKASLLKLKDYFKTKEIHYKPIIYDSHNGLRDGLEKDKCDAILSDKTKLHSIKSTLKNPSNYKILDERVSKEPFSPAVRADDNQWFNIARWTLYILLNAEEDGITSKNVDMKKMSKNPAIQRLLGVTGKGGEYMGLRKDWSYWIIKKVGNYSEIFERHIGINTPLKIKRGINSLWRHGGLMYPVPIR